MLAQNPAVVIVVRRIPKDDIPGGQKVLVARKMSSGTDKVLVNVELPTELLAAAAATCSIPSIKKLISVKLLCDPLSEVPVMLKILVSLIIVFKTLDPMLIKVGFDAFLPTA